ncbi:MAG: DUF3467 domain-containing protein [Deinococcales bacterium]
MKEIKLEVSKEVAKGSYANMAILAHTKDEFILDFAFAYPGQPPFVGNRIITSPQHAKALLRSLEDNIRRYEARFGTIQEMPKRQGDRVQN